MNPGSTESLSETGSAGGGRGKKVGVGVGEEGARFISLTTGLTVVSVSSSSAQQPIPDSDRAKILRYLPDVVLINSAANNGLMLGIDQDPGEVKNQLVSLMEEMTGFVFSLDDVAQKDPFTYFEGWPIIPRVDQSGLYQLIVNSKSLSRSKTMEEDLEDLERLVKTFNIANLTSLKAEAKMIIQVNHVLEFIAYWDCLRKDFSLERRHTWNLKPRESLDGGGKPAGDRFFWVKTNDAGFNSLSIAHKQFNMKRQLDNLGKVKHLESNLFGVENSFLVVFCGKESFTGVDSSSSLNLLELPESALPDLYIPHYEVNEKGLFHTIYLFFALILFSLLRLLQHLRPVPPGPAR